MGALIPEQKHQAERLLRSIEDKRDRLSHAYRGVAHAAGYFDEHPTDESLESLADSIAKAQYQTRLEHEFMSKRLDDLEAFAANVADLVADGLPAEARADVIGTDDTEELLDRMSRLYGIWPHKEFRSANRLER